MAAPGAKRSFGHRCLNRTISNLAREVFYLCTLLPDSALRARPNVRYEGQPGKHMLALSSSQFDPNRTSRYLKWTARRDSERHQSKIRQQKPHGRVAQLRPSGPGGEFVRAELAAF